MRIWLPGKARGRDSSRDSAEAGQRGIAALNTVLHLQFADLYGGTGAVSSVSGTLLSVYF